MKKEGGGERGTEREDGERERRKIGNGTGNKNVRNEKVQRERKGEREAISDRDRMAVGEKEKREQRR
jgi:hypothetical protein